MQAQTQREAEPVAETSCVKTGACARAMPWSPVITTFIGWLLWALHTPTSNADTLRLSDSHKRHISLMFYIIWRRSQFVDIFRYNVSIFKGKNLFPPFKHQVKPTIFKNDCIYSNQIVSWSQNSVKIARVYCSISVFADGDGGQEDEKSQDGEKE